MNRRFFPVHPDDSLRDAARRMREHKIGLLPVASPNGIVGMLSDRDLALRTLDGERFTDPAQAKVRDVMSIGVLACYEDQGASDALHKMVSKRVSEIVVLNSAREPVGTVSLFDLIEMFANTARPASRNTER